MYAVLTCLRDDHDLRLVALAAIVCIVSAVTAFGTYRRALARRSAARVGWIALTGLVGGSGIWATHFLAMLAYQTGLPVGYAMGATILSWLIGLAGIASGFGVAALRQDSLGRLLGGATAGLGAAVMHFVGVSATRLPAELIWDGGLVSAAVLVGAGLCAVSVWIAGDVSRARNHAAAAVAFVLAVCALHFTAMGAVTLLPDPSVEISEALMDRNGLAVQVSVVAGLILVGAVALMVMARTSAIGALQSLRAALDGAPTALAFFDAGRKLVFWNDAYARMMAPLGVTPSYGLSYAAIVEASFASGLMPQGATRDIALSSELLRGGKPAADHPIGETWRRVEIGPTRDGGFVISMTDVTETRVMAQRLAEARDRAEAANRAKSEFLANMSHEIRTPLNGVLGMAEVMAGHPLEAGQAERLRVIRESGASLLSVLNDVLDISKIEAGQFELEVRPFDLAETLRIACEPFAQTAAQKDIDFQVEVAPEAEGGWLGDALRLRQILANLASNAVKFTETGSVRVTARALAEGGLSIAVADTGIGVPAAHMPRLFEKFTQADGSTTRRFGGTGLGLAICRQLVELMGGEIRVESHENAGSIFTLTVPLARCAAPVVAQTAVAGATAQERPLRILAAEDNPTNQLVLRAMLMPLNCELRIVADGREALDAFGAEAFDLILMDVQMPRMNGVEATREIRRREAERGLAPTPIVALTANVMTHQVAGYRAAGVDGFVAKPIEAQRLYLAIDQVLGDFSAASAAAA
jgi:signal transduction histidine kinase/NO-binding membrane sensor protein with MHYT domain/ActR/RegA family two-component response regulator